jgi:hypothetical protein
VRLLLLLVTDTQGPGPAEWSAWYEDYLTRAAGQSTRSLELYQDVMAAVSRGDLTPTVVQDLLSGFVQARGAAYSTDMAELSMRFFSGLVQLGTTYSAELLDAVAPGAAPSARAEPPRVNGADWGSWFRQLTDYATQQGAASIEAYQSLLDRVAAGDLPPTQVQQMSNQYLERRLPEHLRRLMAMCFELMNGLNDVRTRYGEEYFEGVLGSGRPPDDPALFALELVAPIGGTTSASLLLTNTRPDPSVIRCEVTDVRRSDGIGPAFSPQVTIAPDRIELGPGEETNLTMSLLLDARYDPGPLYVGELRVTGHGAERLEVPLRIRATAPS